SWSFYAVADHREPRPFPTRRSSDLVRGRIVGDGVHREVAPREVVLDVVHVLHVIGTAAVGVALLAAEGRDLVAAPPEEHRHRPRSEEHTSELQSRENLVCRLLLEKK